MVKDLQKGVHECYICSMIAEEGLKEFTEISDFLDRMGMKSRHPYVHILRYNDEHRIDFAKVRAWWYCIFLNLRNESFVYSGSEKYVFSRDSLMFFAPGQYVDMTPMVCQMKPSGIGILFHPDLLPGTTLLRRIRQYPFFNYESNEALQLGVEDKNTFLRLVDSLDRELDHEPDRFQHHLIVNHLETILNYCMRFSLHDSERPYQMQSDFVTQLEDRIADYFANTASKEGFLTVNYLANSFGLSYPYFSDLVRRQTGATAISHIHRVAMSIAKDKLISGHESILDISKALGFQYPNHFSRLFRKICGITPSAYRTMSISKYIQ